MASFGLKVTRLAFALMGTVSPDVAGRAAFRLFCRTPARKPKGAKAQAAFAMGAERLRHAERRVVTVPDGALATYRLAAGEAAARILIVHGWGSRAEYLSELAAALNAAGSDVTLLDLPGHGRSYGRSLNIRSAAEAIAVTEARFGPFDAVVGHSFGGLSLMAAAGGLFAELPAVAAPKLVLVGAPSQVEEVFGDFSRMLRLAPATSRAMTAHVERIAGRPVEAFDMARVARRIARPMLVVHAEDDKEVGAHHARAYAGTGEGVSFFWANGYGHRRIVGAREVSEAIASFVLEERAVPAAAGVTGRH